MSEIDYTARARALAPAVIEASAEANRTRHVPKQIAEAMAAAGLYGVAVPASLGGGETHPATQIEVIEAISEADAGTGWALMIGIETGGLLGPNLGRETAEKLYGDPKLIMAGALNPLCRARRVDGGYRVTGQWPFASGIHNAHYFWGQCLAVDDGGEVKKLDNGFPELLEVIVHNRDFEILDTWHTSGLRSSGSHDARVDDVFVPEEMTTRTQAGRPIRETGPLFRFPIYSRLAYNKVGVATGAARAAIRAFNELANSKKPRAAFKLLRERTSAQLAIADAERTLRSSRAFVFEAVGEMWESIAAGNEATARERAILQLACSHATKACFDAVAPLIEAAGTSANAQSSRLGRAWNDVQVVRQHIMVSPQWIEAVGRALLGVPTESPFF